MHAVDRTPMIRPAVSTCLQRHQKDGEYQSRQQSQPKYMLWTASTKPIRRDQTTLPILLDLYIRRIVPCPFSMLSHLTSSTKAGAGIPSRSRLTITKRSVTADTGVSSPYSGARGWHVPVHLPQTTVPMLTRPATIRPLHPCKRCIFHHAWATVLSTTFSYPRTRMPTVTDTCGIAGASPRALAFSYSHSSLELSRSCTERTDAHWTPSALLLPSRNNRLQLASLLHRSARA
ncbi:uncharacterized protein BDW70DRAFT_140878 [Aspergillus foveolatus]|uniref:uncharacterized protein n=1 Tax=Aspergillus foveolatus TaxID=210207 RepID=UPI003CCD0F7F